MHVRSLRPEFVSPLDLVSSGGALAPIGGGGGLGAPVNPGALSGAFSQLIDDARKRDVVAQDAVESFARNEDPGRIHETMVAVSKAEISLRTLASVRNKLIDAYHELLHVTT